MGWDGSGGGGNVRPSVSRTLPKAMLENPIHQCNGNSYVKYLFLFLNSGCSTKPIEASNISLSSYQYCWKVTFGGTYTRPCRRMGHG